MVVTSGKFRLFTADPVRTDTNNLVYELNLLSVEGKSYAMSGFKVVDNSAKLNPVRLWEQTTTLYVKVDRISNAPKVAAHSDGFANGAANVNGLRLRRDTVKTVGLGLLVSLTGTSIFSRT